MRWRIFDGERLPVRVADYEAGVGLLSGPKRREAARRGHGALLARTGLLHVSGGTQQRRKPRPARAVQEICANRKGEPRAVSGALEGLQSLVPHGYRFGTAVVATFFAVELLLAS
jgi:hypothetical protein